MRHLDTPRTAAFLKKLAEFRAEVRNRPYEKDQLELIKAAYDGPWGNNQPDLSSIFCSELVAEAYQRLGLLSRKIPANEFTPADWANPELNLMGSAKLSRDYLLKLG